MIKKIVLTSKFTKVIDSEIKHIFKNEYTIYNDEKSFSEKNLKHSQGLCIWANSGGIESIASKIISNYKKPILLFTNGKKNSLAAGLEIYSYFKNSKNIIFEYSENIVQEDLKKINDFALICKSLDKIKDSNLGLIGEPSSWLLSSKNYNFENYKHTKIKISELVNNYEKIELDEKLLTNIKKRFIENNFPENEIIKSTRMYQAMKELIKKYNLDLLTIKCFDLLERKVTACLALALLNDEGITAGCEGDIETTYSMFIAKLLTDQTSWMANPSSLNLKENSITFAHCTIPTKMLKKEDIRFNTHMESNLSSAVEGALKKQDVTIFRFGNGMKKANITSGKILKSDMKNPQLCRTQAIVKIDTKIEKWIKNSCGNHNVIIYGNHKLLFEKFCLINNIDLS